MPATALLADGAVDRLAHRNRVFTCVVIGSLVGAALPISHAAAQVPFATVADSARLAPRADERIAYGADPEQFIELRVPRSGRRHPVVMLLHGGCWSSQYDVTHLAATAEALRREGIATWAVEYRRAGHAGGGDPGTFDDVRAAYALLIAQAKERDLDRSRIVLMGHSAGGHLALWLASEPGVKVRGTVGLAAVTDPVAFAQPTGCGAGITRLMGGEPTSLAAAYAARSPVARPAPRSAVRLLVARDDRIVPRTQLDAYLARFPGARVEEVSGGHFDLVAPWTEGGRAVPLVVRALLR
jgi:acetyl esterase/lipase